MASDTKNVKIGVCKVIYGGVDLGYTQGGVEVTVKTDTHKVNVDQFGKTTINEYIMGREVMVKVPLAETTLTNLVAIMPGATLVTNGADIHVDVTNAIGTDLLSTAKQLRLHPKALPDSNVSEDFVIPLAATAGGLTFAYKLENERIFNCDFTGYPDPVTAKLFAIGSPVTP
ncbi:hypothetical protein QN372_00485 [Undibacterium sp. RTI2.1]|uniref:hypothetical protein n=1 Tax=unclassified Undibacterium TaxID=2630295 RepID=UPI002AB4FF55|nr:MULTISPECIES: hypothetical protein [unclassified Undibacterium]MDY7537615.1 hypothetical protein [Undibacterium sp. 5I1]MEB0029216.1 hypothetical protein [Undibacterium sp. RTI2.1]MEB0115524.1 hypothetical protein [Undibacterium sp. RTI2.2]MEB0230160.1 hypothetical protein [Undibacterium sp. 10I3]MEB0256352.1 hypothetical protein [Undibacterium sp. 5I1]